MQFINHYSFLILAGAAIFAVLVWILRRGSRKEDLIALGALLLGLTMAFWLFQPADLSSQSQSTLQIEGASQPVLIQFESPYCLGCMAAKPMVDSLRAQTGDSLLFMPVDINDPETAALVSRFGAQFTPTFILLDTDGKILYRSVGAVENDTILDLLAELPADDES